MKLIDTHAQTMFGPDWRHAAHLTDSFITSRGLIVASATELVPGTVLLSIGISHVKEALVELKKQGQMEQQGSASGARLQLLLLGGGWLRC